MEQSLNWDREPDDRDSNWGKLVLFPVHQPSDETDWPDKRDLREISQALTDASQIRIPTFDIAAVQESLALVGNRIAQMVNYTQTDYYHAMLSRMVEQLASVGDLSRRLVTSAGILAMFDGFLEPSSYNHQLLAILTREPSVALRLLEAVQHVSASPGVERASISYSLDTDNPAITLWARIPIEEPNFDEIEERLYTDWYDRYADLASVARLAVI